MYHQDNITTTRITGPISRTAWYFLFSFVSGDGIRESEGTIGTEPTHGSIRNLTLKVVRQSKCHFM